MRQFLNWLTKVLQGWCAQMSHLPMASASMLVVATTSLVLALMNTCAHAHVMMLPNQAVPAGARCLPDSTTMGLHIQLAGMGALQSIIGLIMFYLYLLHHLVVLQRPVQVVSPAHPVDAHAKLLRLGLHLRRCRHSTTCIRPCSISPWV